MSKKLLFSVTIKDCEVQTFRSGGKGGQRQNKVETGVRIIHRASGAVGECRQYRKQIQNKREAFKRMAESKKFKLWVKIQAGELAGKPTIDEIVDNQMEDKNLLIEYRDEENRWKPQSPAVIVRKK